jgi:hypothetical protein
MSRASPRAAATLTFVAVLLAGQLAVGMRASRTASVTGDEPFYLLTTQSLASDHDLDLADDYAHHEERRFWDGTVPLWRQMTADRRGRLLSPHDPGLSILILPAYVLGGLDGARRFLVVLWALAMALATLLAVRLRAPPMLAAVAAIAVGVGAPGIVYASQVYPEGPAALLVAAALLLITDDRARPILAAAVLIALPWLGFKYLPLVAVLAAAFAWRHSRRGHLSRQKLLVALLVGLLAGAHYVWWHLHTFGGLTPYASNIVFSGEGSARIVADHLGQGGRSYRLYGLFLDARFGLFRWFPIALVAVAGIRRQNVLVATIVLTTVVVGTFASITMMGWWFPARMLVAGLPALVVLVAHGAERLPKMAAALAAWSALIGGATAWAAHHGAIRLAVDPWRLGAPLPPHWLFPDFRHFGPSQVGLSLAWGAAALALRRAARRAASRAPGRRLAADGQALAPRRQLARLPRLLRPAD